MSPIDPRHIVLPLPCALLLTLGNLGCGVSTRPGEDGGGIRIDAGAGTIEDAGSEADGGLDDAGDESDDDAGGGAVLCGTRGADSCAAGEFCNFEPAAGGQGCDGSIADAAGVCEARPELCTDEYAPVCGCDHRSYSNACSAHAAGAAVLHRGWCTDVDCAGIGGRAVDGIGPPAMCPTGEVEHTWIGYSNGTIAIEGTACCVPE